ncbi:motility protein A [Candidatus Raskinella chloraquaticus]|uniref:Flagellar motor protein PomA n=1 Tax=Candidatus Raskinella chloraquaticus TaxID=1951219 RepID=A0A1W9HUY2_9HYPH|nr:MAG: flagellar motor protein PomA [Proteobacteria bacterium SG_bin8]
MKVDLGSVLGFVAAITVLYILMTHDGDISAFWSEHAALVIGGGVISATLVRFPMKTTFTGLISGMKMAIAHQTADPRELIEQITELADVVRKKGPIALETVEVDNEFLAKGVRMIADGYDSAFIRETLERERDLHATRMEDGGKVYKAIGDCAPAFGMVGTIIGMVQMFAHMSDPSKLGPSMAVALLATLYGAVIANFVCMPVAEKLEMKLHHDEIVETLVIDGVLQIRENKSPALIREMLLAYLPHKHREAFEEAA